MTLPTTKKVRDTVEPPSSFESIDSREQKLLAAYAFPSHATRGRKYSEPGHRYRGPFQRDRDRIVHSAAFRRLSGKMQVFTGDMGDYHRTRLTHTMEVTSVARTIARALRLNEDLVEAMALLHDIGHPPFGHAGEDALDACLADAGGFSHNAFALTLVEELEQRYPEFPGLNLSHEVLEGQRTRIHKKVEVATSGGQDGPTQPILEVQVVEAADGIAYNAHDVDDALKLELVTFDELAPVPLVDTVIREMQAASTSIPPQLVRQVLVRRLVDCQVSSLIEATSGRLLRLAGPYAPGDSTDPIIGMETSVAVARRGLAEFLFHRIYRHPRLLKVRCVAQDRLRWLFQFYLEHLTELPEPFRRRMRTVGPPRAVGEYLAGMTDRYCTEQYERHSPGPG